MSTLDYAELVKKADAAVASVKDENLKKIAFEKVLEQLLSGGTAPATAPATATAKAKVRAKSSEKAAAKSGPAAYLQEMFEDEFFLKQKSISEVKTELENRGHHIPLTSLSGPLQKLCKEKVLRRQKNGANKFVYSNW
jgi:phosphoglycerate-specific signal transduction histidine kinase